MEEPREEKDPIDDVVVPPPKSLFERYVKTAAAKPEPVPATPAPAPTAEPDIQAAEASKPKVLPYSPDVGAKIAAATSSAPISHPRQPTLKRHEQDTIGPILLEDPPPPPTAEPIPYGRGRGTTPVEPRHRPAEYTPTRVQVQQSEDTEVRAVAPVALRPPPARSNKDPTQAAIDDAVAGLGPPESVVDVLVEVFDENIRQFWQIGSAFAQPLSVIKVPTKYLKYAGYYRVSMCPSGDGFNPKNTRSFTARIMGPPRPANWMFDESDVGGTVYGDRGGYSMGFASQPVMPPPQDPAETVVRSVRALKEVEKIIKPDEDEREKRRVEELEAELRQSRMGPMMGPPGYGYGGGGWGGWAPPPYRRDREDEQRRRDEEERRRREEDERRRREDDERRRAEEQRRVEEQRREEQRRVEDQQRRDEQARRDEQHRREMAELTAKFEVQMADAQRRAEDERRAREEETRRRADQDRWQDDRRRVDAQIEQLRHQNELILQKFEQQPRETALDKLLPSIPGILMQWKQSSDNARSEQLETRRLATEEQRFERERVREENRLERERAREEAAHQSEMWNRMSQMQVESVRTQADQSSQYTRNLLEIMGKNNNGDILNSVAGAMRMAVDAQTNVMSAIAKSGLAGGGGGGGGGPSPWVDVAAGAIDAAGRIATSVIAAKAGAPPEAMRAMMGLSEEEMPAPPVRRPPAMPAPQQQPPTRVAIPRQEQPQGPPQARSPQQAKPQQPPQGEQQTVPGMPNKIVARVLQAAQKGEPPETVARKLFSLVELCDVHGLHHGNAEAEHLMEGLTTEALMEDAFKEFFTKHGGVENEEYLEAIREVYIKLIYAYVAALRNEEGEDEGQEEAEETQAAEEEEAVAEAQPQEEPAPIAEAPAPAEAETPPVAEPAPQELAAAAIAAASAEEPPKPKRIRRRPPAETPPPPPAEEEPQP